MHCISQLKCEAVMTALNAIRTLYFQVSMRGFFVERFVLYYLNTSVNVTLCTSFSGCPARGCVFVLYQPKLSNFLFFSQERDFCLCFVL